MGLAASAIMTTALKQQSGNARRYFFATSVALALQILLVATLVAAPLAQAQTFTVLYSFTGGADGAYPVTGLIRDAAGNLYGTTSRGGASAYGAVFKLDATGNETVLHSFNYADGAYPSTLIRDAAGNLYGTTNQGGASGWGAVFKLDATGKYEVLYDFTGGADGAIPAEGLTRDPAGNLYGTTDFGGASGFGTVFKLDATGEETVLHSFHHMGGAGPSALIRDAAGNLYGTTLFGGAYRYGAVFKLDATGKYEVLYDFTAGADGAYPAAGLIRDAAGNLYGTTSSGGPSAYGTVFKLDTTGNETVLYDFTGVADGRIPAAGLTRDPAGNLYGTTEAGGASGFGTVFKLPLNTTGNETVLHSFTGGADGAYPRADLIRDAAGNLYGTTEQGGAFGRGAVFKLTP
jgi:uncharacterized repeat protein (TIGR03803 family)